MCPPPDTGLYSIAWRLGAFVPQQVGLFGVGVSNVAAIALLVGCVQVAACPSKLRHVRNGAAGLVIVALLPFVGAVAALNYDLLTSLMEYGWYPRLVPPFIRHIVCCFVLLMLGAFAAASPALAVALSVTRLRGASEQRQLDPTPWRKWVSVGGAPLGLLLLCVTWDLGTGNVGRAAATLWTGGYTGSLLEMPLAILILSTLLAAAIAAVIVPIRAANHPPQPRQTPAAWSTDPSRFAAYPAPPKRTNPPVNLQA
ncbi:MAG TPA: hypothetical protein VHP33_27525 [Polyangiaceae bacterium]|nr:hypothetical protein [Polyangiaceae bacterium]